jgi:hypothetical protein
MSLPISGKPEIGYHAPIIEWERGPQISLRNLRKRLIAFAQNRLPLLLTALLRARGNSGRNFRSTTLEAKIAHEVSAFVLDHVGTLQALQSSLGIVVTERRGLLVIRFGGA